MSDSWPSYWLKSTCRTADLDARLQDLLHDRGEELSHMRLEFDQTTSVSQSAQAVVSILYSCGYPLLAPKESDPSFLDDFICPFLRSITIHLTVDTAEVYWRGKPHPHGRVYQVRTSAKDRHDLILAIHRQADKTRRKELRVRADNRRQRKEAALKIASVAETLNAVKLRDVPNEGQNCLMTVAD